MAIKIAPLEPDLSSIRKPRQLWRVLGWGGAATIALAAVAFVSQTDAGGQRLQLAVGYLSDPVRVVADLSEPAGVVAPIPVRVAENQGEKQAETQRLAAQVHDLAADRERLTARIVTLERSLDDMTGSIKQQSEQLAKARAAVPPPAPSAPTTVATTLPPLAPLAMPAIRPTATPENPPPQAVETKPDTVPVPPVRVAAAPVNEPAAEPSPPAKVEFGIDLGGATTLDALRIHWATMKANYGPLLVGLHPLASQYPKHPSGVDYRLVAGPLPNSAEATKLCARLPVTRTGCRPAKFDGAQLAEH
jgi:hypothetical protein